MNRSKKIILGLTTALASATIAMSVGYSIASGLPLAEAAEKKVTDPCVLDSSDYLEISEYLAAAKSGGWEATIHKWVRGTVTRIAERDIFIQRTNAKSRLVDSMWIHDASGAFTTMGVKEGAVLDFSGLIPNESGECFSASSAFQFKIVMEENPHPVKIYEAKSISELDTLSTGRFVSLDNLSVESVSPKVTTLSAEPYALLSKGLSTLKLMLGNSTVEEINQTIEYLTLAKASSAAVKVRMNVLPASGAAMAISLEDVIANVSQPGVTTIHDIYEEPSGSIYTTRGYYVGKYGSNGYDGIFIQNGTEGMVLYGSTYDPTWVANETILEVTGLLNPYYGWYEFKNSEIAVVDSDLTIKKPVVHEATGLEDYYEVSVKTTAVGRIASISGSISSYTGTTVTMSLDDATNLNIYVAANKDLDYEALATMEVGKKYRLSGFMGWRNGPQLIAPVLIGEVEDDPVDPPTPPTESKEISFYAINDFHGAVLPSGNNAGIVSTAGYLKSLGKDTTVLINSGDMFQGSIESNYNYGKLLSECMGEIGFDEMTIGNHEFDWGAEYIEKFGQWSGIPILGANIYHYDIDSKTTLGFASEIASKYAIVEKDGVKIGIIGTIGSSQITSICSLYADPFSFEDPTPIIKAVSDELRMNKGCDVVVVSHHGEQDQLVGTGITSISPMSGKRYVDACFCAHSHQNESTSENGVPFVQTEGYGAHVAKVVLTVDEANVGCKAYTTSLAATGYRDANVESLVASYKRISDTEGKEVVCTTDDTYFPTSGTAEASNIAAAGIFDAAKKQGYDVDFAITNNARAPITANSYQMTYAELYQGLPFDNQVIIGTCQGSDLIAELVNYTNYCYRNIASPVTSNGAYRIAIIDYLGLHRNSRRNLDYFKTLSIEAWLDGHYRKFAYDYLKAKGSISKSDYSFDLPRFNAKGIQNPVSF